MATKFDFIGGFPSSGAFPTRLCIEHVPFCIHSLLFSYLEHFYNYIFNCAVPGHCLFYRNIKFQNTYVENIQLGLKETRKQG